MPRRSVHYSADLEGCRELSGLSPSMLAAAFEEAIARAGGSIVQRVEHEFPGAGLTCVLVLRESHAVLHTWPELGTVNVDIFCCSPRLRARDAIAELERTLRAEHVSVLQQPRAGGGELPQDG